MSEPSPPSISSSEFNCAFVMITLSSPAPRLMVSFFVPAVTVSLPAPPITFILTVDALKFIVTFLSVPTFEESIFLTPLAIAFAPIVMLFPVMLPNLIVSTPIICVPKNVSLTTEASLEPNSKVSIPSPAFILSFTGVLVIVDANANLMTSSPFPVEISYFSDDVSAVARTISLPSPVRTFRSESTKEASISTKFEPVSFEASTVENVEFFNLTFCEAKSPNSNTSTFETLLKIVRSVELMPVVNTNLSVPSPPFMESSDVNSSDLT